MDWLMQPRGTSGHPSADGTDPIGAMLARFADAGYEPVETPLLGPASVFLDFSGEEIRSGLYLTSDGAGTELCLRPEYTIPVCRAYLASDEAGRQASFAYCGSVFRSAPAEAKPAAFGETLQAGIESFGRPDIAAADAETLALAIEAAEGFGTARMSIRMGDAGLLGQVLEALDLPANWQRRIKRGLDKGLALDTILTDAPSRSADHSGVLAALTGADQKGAEALVEDLLTIAGIDTVGGRSPGEIAHRFMAQVAGKASRGLVGDRKEILQRFLAIKGHPDAVVDPLRAFARDAGLDLARAIDQVAQRANFLALHDRGHHDLVFEAAFGRNLGYYTGFVFEGRLATDDGAPKGEVLFGGGRYDHLAQSLGSPSPVAAVGVALWIDRLRAGQDRAR